MKAPPKITLSGVKSSQVAEAGYDPKTNTLAVRFKSGGLYHYHGVKQDAYDGLMKAESFGKHLQAHIVGKHKHAKI